MGNWSQSYYLLNWIAIWNYFYENGQRFAKNSHKTRIVALKYFMERFFKLIEKKYRKRNVQHILMNDRIKYFGNF